MTLICIDRAHDRKFRCVSYWILIILFVQNAGGAPSYQTIKAQPCAWTSFDCLFICFIIVKSWKLHMVQ